MSGLPFISATGNLVADVELRFSQNGKAIAKCRIACNERKRGEDGEWSDVSTTFLSVTLFGQRAEDATELRKGQRVIVTGRLAQRTWDAPDGTKRSDYEVKADEIAGVPRPGNRQPAGGDWVASDSPADDPEIPF